MSEWQEGTLSDIADFVMGQSPEGETCNESGTGVPLLNGPTEFGIRNPKAVQFTTDPKRFSQSGDILFCVRGSTTGKMNWSDQEYAIGRGLAALRHKNGAEYKYFLKAVIDFNLELLLASATGSTFPNVSKDQIANLEVSIPPPEEQKAIASVLSSLDDKIDLLHRQNTTLERIAETLFRQWFVEEAQEDWEEKSLLDLIELVGGGTPKTSTAEYWDGDIPWLSGGDITNNHKGFVLTSEKLITKEGLKNSSAKLLPKLATVISARGTVGKYCLLAHDMTFSQSNYGILPKVGECYYFTYLLVNHLVEELQSAAYGSVFDTITTSTFREATFATPPTQKMLEFERYIAKFFNKKLNNQQQIQNLKRLRDSLLPKLMSGEVRVKV